jgi:hypothetical protein
MGDGGKGSGSRPFSVSQDQFASNWDAIFGKKKTQQLDKQYTCWCYNCNQDRIDESGHFPYTMTRMILCPDCGNKRCPHSTDHNLACTNSNDPGQPGSRYE